MKDLGRDQPRPTHASEPVLLDSARDESRPFSLLGEVQLCAFDEEAGSKILHCCPARGIFDSKGQSGGRG